MKKLYIILLICLFLVPVRIAAQNIPEPVPSNAELAARLDSLQVKTTAWEKFLSKMPRIGGYIQLGYVWSDTSSSFFIRSARLDLQGDLVKSKLDYRFQIEFASPMKIVDAYLRYRPFGGLNFMLGEYKVPFLIENTVYAPLMLEFIEYPLVVRKLVGSNDVCGIVDGTGRDIGATAYGGFIKRGDYYLINYDLGVFNGEGINLRDANRTKDVVGRLTLKPVKNLLISGSYYWGEYGKDYLKRIRYGGGVAYDGRLGVVRGEYIRGVTGDKISDGWFFVAGWRMRQNLMLAGRAESFIENIDYSGTRQNNYTAAVTWHPVKYLRCQLDYTYEYFHADRDKNRNVVTVMLAGIF